MNKFKFSKQHLILLFLSLLVIMFLIIIFPLIFASTPKVKFNQHYIQNLDREFEAQTFKEKTKSILSDYSLSVNSLFNSGEEYPTSLEPVDVFDYLWKNLPYYSVVYPTEMYYYYIFPLEDGSAVSGNFRLVEAVNGKIGIGYFDAKDVMVSDAKMFGDEEGLEIEQKSEFLYKLTYNGKTVYFELSDIWGDYPKKTKLLEEEELVTKVRDESGIIFYLVFNKKTNSFYYILDEERPVTEILDLHENGTFLVGNRTGYAYYDDLDMDRKILFGISALNVEKNNFFDGPFDQVYPRIKYLRDKIYLVYPYTQFGLGIDEYGNFLDLESTRVAISPYYDYYSTDDLVVIVDSCSGESGRSEFISCLTYEDKKDFHKDSSIFYENGTMKDFNNSTSTCFNENIC